MIGPILSLEMLLGSRRGKHYLFRWIYAGWLLAQLLFSYVLYAVRYQNRIFQTGRPDPNLTSEFVGGFVELFLAQQFLLMLLATPAFAAGALTDDKSRGTLQYLLTADLTAWEIILGKLLGRLAQVALLALTGLPVFCFVGTFAGLGPLDLLALAAASIMPLIALGAASVLASVWCRQTRDAVLGVYAIGLLGYLATGAVPWVEQILSPRSVLEPLWAEGNVEAMGSRLACSVWLWGTVAGLCLGLAVWRLRKAYTRQLQGERKKKREQWWRVQRAAITSDPIRCWKERHVEGLAPLMVLRRVPTWMAFVVVFAAALVASGLILWTHWMALNKPVSDLLNQMGKLNAGLPFLIQGAVVMLLASLVVGIRCSGSVSGERERQTWEALLLTPLETRHLIRGKLWGIIGASYPYLLAYAIPTLFLAGLAGPDALLWALLSLGLTLLAMYFVGAAGIWCSVRSKSSWRSLVGTLCFGYLGGFLIYLVTTPLMWIVAGIIYLMLLIVDRDLGFGPGIGGRAFVRLFYSLYLASCLGLAGIFYFMAWYFTADAEKRVADLERTRYWKDEPAYALRRRAGRLKHSR